MSVFSGGLVAAAVAGLVLVSAPPVSGEPRPGEVVVIAGVSGQWGYSGDGGDATQALLGAGDLPVAVAADGTVYIADELSGVVRVVTPDGVITSLPLDVGPDAYFRPGAVALDGAGVLYIATSSTVRRRDPDGSTTVVAGGGDRSFDGDGGGDGGDGGPATDVSLGGVTDLAIGPDGSLYLSEGLYSRIRRVTPDGTITTIAGGGVGGSVVDTPQHVAVAPNGTVYYTHLGFRGVKQVAPDGTTVPVLGQQTEPGFSGDGGPAAEAAFESIAGLATDSDGNLYVADPGNQVVRMIDPEGVIDSVGPAVTKVSDVAVGPNGDLYLTSDTQIMRLARGMPDAPDSGEAQTPGKARWTDQEPGTVLPLIGNGRERTSSQRLGGGSGAMTAGPDGTVYYVEDDRLVMALRPDGEREVYAGSERGFAGDGGPATEAKLDSPAALAVDRDGNLYIADAWNFRVRKVDTSGTITTVAGKGGELSTLDEKPNGDGGPATDASIMPVHLAPGPDGTLFVFDEYSDGRIRKIDAQGTITSIAGGGTKSEDAAELAADVAFRGRAVSSLVADQNGAVYYASAGRIHRVMPTGEIAAAAEESALNSPRGLAVGADGTLYVADADANLVRAVRPDGSVVTVGGSGAREDSDEALLSPDVVAVDDAGTVYVTTSDTERIRKIEPGGAIETIAELGYVVGGDAADMVVDSPGAVAVDPAGTVFVAGAGPIVAASADGGMRLVAADEGVSSLAAGSDGSLYVPNGGRIERIFPDGATVTVAGLGVPWPSDEPMPDVDGKRAAGSVLDPGDVTFGPGGELYLTSRTRVYRMDGDGTLRLVADVEEELDDSYLRLEIAVSVYGEIYLADSRGGRVLAVNREGEVRTFVDALSYAGDLTVATDGTLYVAASDGIFRVSPDGEVTSVAGRQDGIPPTAVALDAGGNLYFATTEAHRVSVLVRPGELAGPFPWAWVWWGLAALVVLGGGAFWVLRRRRLAEAPPAE